jgi:hypothetical protein
LAEKSLANTEKARELFHSGVRHCPDHGALRQAFAMMEAEEGNVTAARKLFEESIRHCPDHAYSYQAWLDYNFM